MVHLVRALPEQDRDPDRRNDVGVCLRLDALPAEQFERRRRHIDGANHDDRSVLAETVVTAGRPGRDEAQVEWSLLGDQSHHRHIPQHRRMRIEGHAVGSSLDPKAGTELLERIGKVQQVRIVARRADTSIVACPVSWSRAAITPMTTNFTSRSIRTRQIAETWTSLSSGDIAHQPVSL